MARAPATFPKLPQGGVRCRGFLADFASPSYLPHVKAGTCEVTNAIRAQGGGASSHRAGVDIGTKGSDIVSAWPHEANSVTRRWAEARAPRWRRPYPWNCRHKDFYSNQPASASSFVWSFSAG